MRRWVWIVGIILLFVIAGSIVKKIKNQNPVISGHGDYKFSLEHQGVERLYYVHVPSSYNKNIPTPVILTLLFALASSLNMMVCRIPFCK